MSRKTESWKFYWDSGATESCLGTGSGYEGIIKKSWGDFFKEYVKNDSKVLDVCTGNGAIINILLETVDSEVLKTVEVHGVDLAQIKPTIDPFNGAKKVKYEGNINIEELPFENESYDIISSQYGLEYSSLESSIIEVARVLRRKGILRMVLHYENSFVIKQVKAQKRELRTIKESDIFPLAIKYLETNKIDEQLFKQREIKLIKQSNKLSRQMEQEKSGLISNALQALDVYFKDIAKVGIETTIKRIQSAQLALDYSVVRLNDFTDSLLSESEIQKLIKNLEKNQFSISDSKPILQDENIVGFEIIAIKQ